MAAALRQRINVHIPPRVFVLSTLGMQIFLHLFWLPISTQVGQLAIPWLMNQGLTLYGNVIENRPPLVALMSAFALRFSPFDPAFTLKVLNIVLVALISLLVYRVAVYLAHGNVLAGCAGLFVWFLWEPVYGNILFYFDVLVGAVLLLAAYLAVRDKQGSSRTQLCIGLLLGMATLLKQHAWLAVCLYFAYLFLTQRRLILAYMSGVLAFPLAALGVTALQGNLQTYLYWNFEFHFFSGITHRQPLTGNFVRKLLLSNIFVLPFAMLAIFSPEWRKRLIMLLFWVAGCAALSPNYGEIYAMAHLPLTSVMSGGVLAKVLKYGLNALVDLRYASAEVKAIFMIMTGFLLTIVIGWVWTIAAAYAPNPLGIGSIPAYDEFRPIAQQLNQISQPGDTLYVLPMLDGNSQLHVLADMLPSGTWVNGHTHILSVPGLVDTLLEEWEQTPPDYIVDFPMLRQQVGTVIQPLTDFMIAHYHEAFVVENILFNGDAYLYQLNQP